MKVLKSMVFNWDQKLKNEEIHENWSYLFNPAPLSPIMLGFSVFVVAVVMDHKIIRKEKCNLDA